MKVLEGQKAPDLSVSEWLQGGPLQLDDLLGDVVLIEVFQVNCPGCFVHALPEVVRLHEVFRNEGLKVLGLATAFEDYELNTRGHLKRFLDNGELIGEPLRYLGGAGLLQDGCLALALPFPVAMDQLAVNDFVDKDMANAIVDKQIPDYLRLPEEQQREIYQQVESYLASRKYSPVTFDRYQLNGTPTTIVVDRKGMLREVVFGSTDHLESSIRALLTEPA